MLVPEGFDSEVKGSHLKGDASVFSDLSLVLAASMTASGQRRDAVLTINL